MQRKLSVRERDMILAALRLVQQFNLPGELRDIAADSGSMLDDVEIDVLCEELNVGNLGWLVEGADA